MATPPILRLPNELLVLVIRLVCNHGPERYYLDTPYRSVQGLLDLAHVCRLFRNIIKGVPGRTGQLSRPPFMMDLPLLCKASWTDVAAGSGTLPFIIRALVQPSIHTELSPALATLSISRAETIILRGREHAESYCHNEGTILAATRSAPHLTTIRLSDLHADSVSGPEGSTMPDFPVLEVLQLRGCTISYRTNPLLYCTTLTVLVLENVFFWDKDVTGAFFPSTFVRMLGSCSATLRELIVYDVDHLWDDEEEPDGPVALFIDHNLLRGPSNVANLPALEKLSLHAHAYALAVLVPRLIMPKLRKAHLSPLCGYSNYDDVYVRDHVLIPIAENLLGPGRNFDRVLFDRTRPSSGKEFARLVAMDDEDRVLEVSLLNYTRTDLDAGSDYLPSMDNLEFFFPSCVRRAQTVHIAGDITERGFVWHAKTVLAYVFSEVRVLGLHGSCAEPIVCEIAHNTDVAPSLENVIISSLDEEGTGLSLEDVLSDIDAIRERNIGVECDSVVSQLLGSRESANDEMKEEREWMLWDVRDGWEEFEHSLAAMPSSNSSGIGGF
ncbi:hypothetical protein PENSPDRAFT_685470 [Peniophora sp. CONT]|nr:hypothetical protein PENSPDRAFT_685470 [Peniophora sp. CONT]